MADVLELDRIARQLLDSLFEAHHTERVVPAPSNATIRGRADVHRGLMGRVGGPVPNRVAALAGVQKSVAMLGQSAKRGAEPDDLVYFQKERVRASERGMDTVACMVHDDTAYLAVNFKVRRNPAITTHKHLDQFEHSDFGTPDIAGPEQVLERRGAGVALRHALALRVQGARVVCFLTPTVAPTTPFENAKPHAEMQLVRWFDDQGFALRDQVVGVSKPCCGRCAHVLEERGVGFSSRSAGNVTNWSPPESFMVREGWRVRL